jgi:hypothetical protein
MKKVVVIPIDVHLPQRMLTICPCPIAKSIEHFLEEVHMHLQQLCEQRDGFVAERHLDEACRSGERYKLFMYA